MSWKIDVVLLQAVKSLWQKNQVVSVSVAYAKNVLFPKGLAKQADASVKNDIAQKKRTWQKTPIACTRNSRKYYAVYTSEWTNGHKKKSDAVRFFIWKSSWKWCEISFFTTTNYTTSRHYN